MCIYTFSFFVYIFIQIYTSYLLIHTHSIHGTGIFTYIWQAPEAEKSTLESELQRCQYLGEVEGFFCCLESRVANSKMALFFGRLWKYRDHSITLFLFGGVSNKQQFVWGSFDNIPGRSDQGL